MKMKEMFKYALMFIAVLAMSVSFVSCGDDDENEPEPVENNSSSSEENILDVISKNVKVEVSEYVEWEQTITVVSQLSSVYPSKNIKYGVKFVFGYYAEEDEDGNEYYPTFAEGNMTEYGSNYSFTYISFDPAYQGSPVGSSLENLATEAFGRGGYYEMYNILKTKIAQGITLSDDEWELYEFVVEELDDIHDAILYEYDMDCQVFVEIDGKLYIVKTF